MQENIKLPKQLFCTKKDRVITSLILKLKGFDWASKEISRRRYEKYSRLSYSANSLRISEHNLPEVFKIIEEMCDRLYLDIPEAFLLNSSKPTAFCVGEFEPMLLISSSLIELLNSSELRVIITNALLHLHSMHMRCFMLRDLISSAADNVGVFKSVIALPRMLLEEWVVEADISADRGTLYIIDDLDLILDTFSKLASGGIGEQGREFLLAEYADYKQNHDEIPACPLFKTWADLYMGNERYVQRAGCLHEYSMSSEFATLKEGKFSSIPDDIDDVSEEDACAYWDGLNARGSVWEAEDVYEQMAFGFTSINGTKEFLKLYAGDVVKFGVDSASKLTSEVLSGIGSMFSSSSKK